MNILFVATATVPGELTAIEASQRQVLIDLGHTVTLRLHTDPMPSSWSGIDLVVPSNSAQHNLFVPKYNTSQVGVASFDARRFPHSGVSPLDYGPTGNTRTSYWFMSGNAISGPLATGAVTTVYPSIPPIEYAYIQGGVQLPSDAIKWMTRDSDLSDNVIAFGLDIGSTLADGSILTGHRVAVMGISNPDLVADQAVLDYMNRVLVWAATKPPLNIVMSVSDIASLNANDSWAKTHLETQGHTVTLINHASAVPANVSDYDMLVLSSSMQSNQAAKWDNVAIATLSLHLGKFIHSGISTQTYASQGDLRLTRYIEAHPASGSLTGLVTMYASTPVSGYQFLPQATLPAGATIYARHQAGGDRITGILLETGAVLHNSSTSPSRRAAVAINELSIATSDGITHFDNLVAWLSASVGGAVSDTVSPSTPTSVSATSNNDDVTVAWAASTDNVGVVGYEVHRSTTTGFTPQAGTLIASTADTSYVDSNLSNATYYYKVVAYDGANNFSAASTETPITLSYTPPAGGTDPQNILVTVADTAALTADDSWLINFLTSRSHTVTLISHNSAIPSNVDTYNLLMHSQSVNNNQIVPKWDNEPIPVLSMNIGRFVHTEMANTTFSSTGDTRTTAYFNSHAITDPLVGVTTVYASTPTTGYQWIATSAIPSGAVILAHHSSDLSRTIALAFETGALMDGGILAPSRRVALCFRQPELANATGLALIERAIAWTARIIVPDTTSPSIPSGVGVTVSGSSATITWSASSDDTAVAGYQVHRAASSSFTPDVTTQIGDVAGLTHVDSAISPGTYYYRVVAYDAADNISTPSASVEAVIAVQPVVSAYEFTGSAQIPLSLSGVWSGSGITSVSSVTLPGEAVGPVDPVDPGVPWAPGVQPTNTNVGLPGINNPSLTSYPANYYGTGTNNLTLTNRLIEGDLTFVGNNITLIGCQITGKLNFRGQDIIVEDCDVGTMSISYNAKRVRVSRTRFTGNVGDDGIHITSNGGVGTRIEDILIEDCFVGNPMLSALSHYDSIQVRGVDRLTIRGNTIDMGTTFDSRYNATVFLEDAQGGNDTVLIQNNWLRAAGYYNVRPYGTNVSLIDNIFYPENAEPVIGNAYPYAASGNTLYDGTPLNL